MTKFVMIMIIGLAAPSVFAGGAGGGGSAGGENSWVSGNRGGGGFFGDGQTRVRQGIGQAHVTHARDLVANDNRAPKPPSGGGGGFGGGGRGGGGGSMGGAPRNNTTCCSKGEISLERMMD